MRENLVIYLSQHYSKPHWFVVNNGIVRQRALQDDANGLAQIAEDKLVIVIVPAEAVLLTSVNLPIVGDHTQGNVPVAVVSKQKMEEWVTLLKSWGIYADVFVPASLALPFETGKPSVISLDNTIVRMSGCQGFACDLHNLKSLLGLTSPDDIRNYEIDDLAIEVTKNIPVNLLHG